MEGLVASDGGRVLKAGLLAFGTLLCATPLMAQPASDPLAPLPTIVPPAQPTVTFPSQLTTYPTQAQPAPATPGVPVPRDWRGVFDAIDSGNWASAQAGISALPPSVLTPVAK